MDTIIIACALVVNCLGFCLWGYAAAYCFAHRGWISGGFAFVAWALNTFGATGCALILGGL